MIPIFAHYNVTFTAGYPSNAFCKAFLHGEVWDVDIYFPENSLCMALSMRTIAEKLHSTYPKSHVSAYWPRVTINNAVFTKDVRVEITSILSSITYTLPTLRSICRMTLQANNIYHHEVFKRLLTRSYDISIEELEAISTHSSNLMKGSQGIPFGFSLRR